MRIIIVGAGEVGYHIAERLASESQDVVVVEQDEEVLRQVSEHLDVQCVQGSGSSPAVLLKAGIEQASLFIAVTTSDEVNIVACLVASALGRNEATRVARIRENAYFQDPRIQDLIARSVDLHINPDHLAAEHVLSLFEHPGVTDVATFADGRLELVAMPLQKDSALAGRPISDIAAMVPDQRILIVAIRRGEEVIVPAGTDELQAGDTIYVVATPDSVSETLRLLGPKAKTTERVMIAGSTLIAVKVARGLLEKGVQTKLIESNTRRAHELAHDLPKVVVLRSDATDRDLLVEEYIQDMDAFVAATGDQEENILSALLAKRLGARFTVVVADRPSYVDLMRTVGIDVVISPRLGAVSSILQFVRRGRVLAGTMLGDEAEALEIEVSEGMGIARRPLRKIRFPKGALLGAIIRPDEIVIPGGDDVIQVGDRVLIFALETAVPEVEQLLAHGERSLG